MWVEFDGVLELSVHRDTGSARNKLFRAPTGLCGHTTYLAKERHANRCIFTGGILWLDIFTS